MVPLDSPLRRGIRGAALKYPGASKAFGVHTPYRPGTSGTAAATGRPLERKGGLQTLEQLR